MDAFFAEVSNFDLVNQNDRKPRRRTVIFRSRDVSFLLPRSTVFLESSFMSIRNLIVEVIFNISSIGIVKVSVNIKAFLQGNR